MTDFEKQISFIMELDKIKKITRQTYLSDGSRKENDAEHSWHLALMAFVLADYANEPIDVLKTMKMVLLHDVIEIDAGDTYAYDTEGNKTKRERELKAADRIFGLLPEAQQKEYRGLWDEFEAMETPESKFANMLDKVQPLFLNDASFKNNGCTLSNIFANFDSGVSIASNSSHRPRYSFCCASGSKPKIRSAAFNSRSRFVLLPSVSYA